MNAANHRYIGGRRRQQGVVLLSLVLVLVAAASYILIRGLNEASQNRGALNQVDTRAILKEAKAALIGYSVSYPDIDGHANYKGPGRLPCPDYEFQGAPSDPIGSADSCSLGAATETGLFPFLTVDTNEMFDASGARLWYAVSDNHRANAAGAINSDTPGTLNVDSTDDIVAIIIAPGSTLAGQNRSTDDTADFYDVGQFLEGENASKGDNAFTSIRGPNHNDEIITITRSELMAAAEHRVLTTVRNALDQYFADPDGDDVAGDDPDCPPTTTDCDNAYPWLSVFSNPAVSDFASTPGVREGHLPVIANGRPIISPIDFQWDIPTDGTYTGLSDFDPNGNCARQSSCDVTGGGIMTPTSIGAGGATCTWQGRSSINCSTVEVVDLGGGDQLEREYVFEFDGIVTSLTPPMVSDRRHVNYLINNGRLPPEVSLARITLTDNKLLSGGGIEASGSVSLELAAGDAVNLISFQGIQFDLEIDHDDKLYPAAAASGESTSPGELPAWFFEDEWHHLVVVSYAAAEQPGDPDADCSIDDSCLTLSWDREGHKPDNNVTGVRGIAVIAGPDLSSSRPSAALSDYFEDENASFGDDIFARIDGSTSFNDQLRVLNPDE